MEGSFSRKETHVRRSMNEEKPKNEYVKVRGSVYVKEDVFEWLGQGHYVK